MTQSNVDETHPAEMYGPANPTPLTTDSASRKAAPVTTGVLRYFPLAIMEVARVSQRGNEQHNPGQPLHWAREKSTDHADCLVRHLLECGKRDADGMRHTAKVAWRALALLQTELEQEAADAPSPCIDSEIAREVYAEVEAQSRKTFPPAYLNWWR